jgi:hypothetical protein
MSQHLTSLFGHYFDKLCRSCQEGVLRWEIHCQTLAKVSKHNQGIGP